MSAWKGPRILALLLGLLLTGSGLFLSVSQPRAQFSAPYLSSDPSARERPGSDRSREPEPAEVGRGSKAGDSGPEKADGQALRGRHGRVEEGQRDVQGRVILKTVEPEKTRKGRDPVVAETETPLDTSDEEQIVVEKAHGVEQTGQGYSQETDQAEGIVPEKPADKAIVGESPGVWVLGEAIPLVQPMPSEKLLLGLTPERYQYPGELLEPTWSQCLAALESGSISSLQSALNRLYEAKLDSGFRNMPDYATLLIRQAHRRSEARDFPSARLLAETAYNLAPEYYPVSLSLSRIALKDPERGVTKYLGWRWVSLKQRLHDFLWQFTTVGKAFGLLLMAVYLFFLFLVFYFLGRHVRVLLHFVHERMPVGSFGAAAASAVLTVTVLVLLFLPGPFWVTVFLGLLMGRFAPKWERVGFSLFLLFWAVSPWLLNQAVCFFSPLSDETKAMHRCTRGTWDVKGEEALKRAVQANPASLELCLTKALVEKRRAEYDEAVRTLEAALRAHPEAGSLWNNLGNLRAIQGDFEEAKADYRRAAQDRGGTAASHYNLSQLLRREFAFLRGAQEFQAARRMDAERVDYFTYIHSQNPNRFFIDEEPPLTALWRHSFYRDPDTERAAEDLWRSTAAGVPLRQTPWVFLLLGMTYVLFISRRRSGYEPFACSACGRVVCGKCDAGAEVGGLCSPCYQALYQRENIPRERRLEQMRKMARYQSKRSRRLLILNFVMPGLGLSLLDDKPQGMFLLFGFVLLMLVAVFWSAMLPVPMTVWETGGPILRILSFVVVILLYGLVQRMFFAKIRARR